MDKRAEDRAPAPESHRSDFVGVDDFVVFDGPPGLYAVLHEEPHQRPSLAVWGTSALNPEDEAGWTWLDADFVDEVPSAVVGPLDASPAEIAGPPVNMKPLIVGMPNGPWLNMGTVTVYDQSVEILKASGALPIGPDDPLADGRLQVSLVGRGKYAIARIWDTVDSAVRSRDAARLDGLEGSAWSISEAALGDSRDGDFGLIYDLLGSGLGRAPSEPWRATT